MIIVEDYVNVRKKAETLGCKIPTTIALLPRNFDSSIEKQDLLHESTVGTIRMLFSEKGISETPLEIEGENFNQILEQHFDWVSPVIFISSQIIQNKELISLLIDTLVGYLKHWTKGLLDPKVKLYFAVEKESGTSKKLNYEGPVEGLKEIPTIIEAINDE